MLQTRKSVKQGTFISFIQWNFSGVSVLNNTTLKNIISYHVTVFCNAECIIYTQVKNRNVCGH
jgi:hypothetical protein